MTYEYIAASEEEIELEIEKEKALADDFWEQQC